MNCLRLLRLISLTGTLWLQLGSFTFEVAAAAPPNDRFSNAQVISGSSGTTTGTTIGASKQPGEPDHADNPGGNSIWFRWTAPATGLFLFDTFGSSFDTLLAVYTGTSVDALIVVTNNDDYGFDLTSEVGFRAIAGITYQLAVDGYDGTNGSVILHWAPEPPPPANDNFANATLITGANGSTNANNSGATLEPGEPVHADVPGGRSVWFRWTAPATGSFSFNTVGSLVDTLLAVYTGGSVNALTLVAANDDFPGADFRSSASFRATNGITYFVAIDGSYSHAGLLVLNWVFEVPPANDNFASAIVITGASGSVNATNTGATLEPGEPAHAADPGGRSIWFRWTAPVTGHFSFNTVTSVLDTILAVYTGGNVNALTLIANDDFAGSFGSSVSFRATVGTTYFVAIDARYSGTLVLNWGGVISEFPDEPLILRTLHHFTNSSDGARPHSELVLSGNTLYGTTVEGGTSGNGTVFKVNTDGTGYSILHQFNYANGSAPFAGLVVSGNTLYGTTRTGGSSGWGTVFSVRTNGAGFTNLYKFTAAPGTPSTNRDGALPHAPLTLSASGNVLYGATTTGGTGGNGTLFAVNTDGTGFTNLYHFSATSESVPGTNSNGANPYGKLIVSGDTLYGTTFGGGALGYGTVFKVGTNGSGFATLRHFGWETDGAYPRTAILSGNRLYGTGSGGGKFGNGIVFAVNTDGTGYTNLYQFSGVFDPPYTNRTGANPFAGLVLAGDTLYGATSGGGYGGKGTLFAVNTNGTNFKSLYHFTSVSGPAFTNNDGATLRGEVVFSGNTLFGSAERGGSSGAGTIFSLSLTGPPHLAMTLSQPNVILRWTNAGPFSLQTTTNLSAFDSWSAVGQPAVTNAAEISVTVPAAGERKFFRLKSQ
jgi:uncharacterized repeat protein (TIGR03803 family)